MTCSPPLLLSSPGRFAGRRRRTRTLLPPSISTSTISKRTSASWITKYRQIEQQETRYETYLAEDAEILLVGYGIVSRVLRSAVNHARMHGIKAGLLRPITVFPFPSRALAEIARRCASVLVVELSMGQMIEDVRLAVQGKVPVELYARVGGNVPSVEEVYLQLLSNPATAKAAAAGAGSASSKHMAASV